jgi:hypothetical protein
MILAGLFVCCKGALSDFFKFRDWLEQGNNHGTRGYRFELGTRVIVHRVYKLSFSVDQTIEERSLTN